MDKLFHIQIGGIKESITNLESLESALASIEKKTENINKNGGFSVASKDDIKNMDELAKLTQKLELYDEQYAKAVAAAKKEISERNKEVKTAVEVENAYNTVQNKTANTYAEKQQRLQALGKIIRNTNAVTDEEIANQKELIRQYADLNQELKDYDAAMGNHYRNVGDYGQATKNLKQELREYQMEMANMLNNGVDKADPKFVELAKKAGQLKDAMQDAGEEMKRFASDTKRIDDVINIAQSATAAFELYKGAMSAFGFETEETEKAIQQLAGAMSIIQSLQTLSNTLQEGSATAKLYHGALKLLGVEFITNQKNAIAATVANQGLSTAQKAASVSAGVLRIALASIGLGLIIGLVATLVTHWEDLVGWFEKTFPALKRMGGLMNGLKATVMGLGKAIVQWLTNPIKTLADVMGKVLKGDFAGAIEAAKNGLKNQFTGFAKAFKEGFTDQVNRGLEDMTRKQAAEFDKQLTHQKNMITKQKNADGTYRKEYIEANKKMFENRKKMYKKDSDEYRKVLEDEAQFYQQVEDAKTSANDKANKARAAANKKTAADAKKAAEEQRKAENDAAKGRIAADKDYQKELINQRSIENKFLQKQKEFEAEAISSRSIEEFVKKMKELNDLKSGSAENTEEQINKEYELLELWGEFTNIFPENQKEVEKLKSVWGDILNNMFDAYDEGDDKLREAIGDTVKLTEEQFTRIKIILQKHKNFLLQNSNEQEEGMRGIQEKIIGTSKAELDSLSKSADMAFKILKDKVKQFNVDPVVKDNIWGKLFGVTDKDKTLKKYEYIKQHWVKTMEEIDNIVNQENYKWDAYIDRVKELYGEDSNKYKEAVQEKMDALQRLYDLQEEVAKRANTPTSLQGDYNGDNNPDTKPKKKLWYGKGDKKQDGTPYSVLDNLSNLFENLDEMVLAPAMDTFSMYMDFAIEETQQKLEQVEELHDKALDKVSESADKIKELNEALKDSSNDNMDATKQQLADEQLLYAQRLAEERKLQEQEKGLKNKAAQQEANARKMELRYQMFMAIANTAQGASKALATWGWPLGPVFAGIMAALGAVQVGLIAKQIGAIKPIKYADGGILQGKSHAQGGIPVGNTGLEVEGGEMVVNKKDTARYADVLSKINRNDPSVRYLQGSSKKVNADAKIRKFANGGQLNFQMADENLRANQSTSRLMNAIGNIDMQPVVAVKDIWRVEDRLVKVRSLAGKSSH